MKTITAFFLAAWMAVWPLGANPLLVLAGSPPAVSCATSDTTLPHDQLLEGFNGTGYENTWTETGTLNEDADTTSLTTNKPTGACNEALYVDVLTNEVFSVWNRGSAITLASQAVDVYFYIYVATMPSASGEAMGVLQVGSSASSGSGITAAVQIKNASGSYYLLATGSTASADISVTTGQWIKVKLHLDTTAASSYIQVDDGSQQTFTRNSTNMQYLLIGGAVYVETNDNLQAYFDLVCVDFP